MSTRKRTIPPKAYWLMKAEPDDITVAELRALPDSTSPWDGVRNYQARNFMKAMKVDDEVFFYVSNVKKPSIVARMQVVKEAYTDPTQFDPQDKHFDPKSTKETPKWEHVDVKLLEEFKFPVLRETLKKLPWTKQMPLFKQSRLSVQPVDEESWTKICDMAHGEEARGEKALEEK